MAVFVRNPRPQQPLEPLGKMDGEVEFQASGLLVFFVNGRKVTDSNVDPEWTLLHYLRNKLGLCGTKLGCAEGGCGACTVMVSRVDRGSGPEVVRHLAVNACLTPVCAMHGMAVTTVEGIGSTRTRLHPVQERIAKAHGSQCGFCTPGIVMSMYALLRSKSQAGGKPTMHDLEVAMQGNLCRCTGYRPILEGFRTFTEEWEQSRLRQKGGCPMGDRCCKFNGNAGHNNQETNGFCGEVSNDLDEKEPNGHHGEVPNGHHGEVPNGHHGEVPNGHHGEMPNGHHGEVPNGHHSEVPNGRHGEVPNGHHGEVPNAINHDVMNGLNSDVSNHLHDEVLKGTNGKITSGLDADVTNGLDANKHNGLDAKECIGLKGKGTVTQWVSGVPVLPNQGGCNAIGAIKKTSHDEHLFGPESFMPYDPTQEAIFPSELKISPELDFQRLRFKGPRVTWYRPTNLTEALYLKQRFPKAKLITGNTEVGVEVKFKSVTYPVLISTSRLRELHAIHEDADGHGLRVGAAVSLSQLDAVLRRQIASQPRHKTRIFSSMRQILKWFAGRQIRNVAGIGGAIMTGSPISDLNPIFMAAGCCLELQSAAHGKRMIPMDNKFFTGYRTNVVLPEEILVSVVVPFTSENEYFCAFKQARRREDDIAIVNLAMRVVVDPESGRVADAAMAFGGMAPTTVLAPRTREAMLSRPMDSSFLEDAFSSLSKDLPLSPGAPGGMVKYRQALSLSLFFKGFLSIYNEIPGLPPLDNRLRTSVQPLSDRPLSSAQYYQSIPGTQEKTDFVGRPIVHQSAFKQATGEAVYCDDIPLRQGELFLALVLSSRAHARILSVDPSLALELPGVHGLVDARDVSPGNNSFGLLVQDEELFATKEVVCQGQAIAAVVAEDALTARRAAALVRVTYEDLPAILTIEEAIAAESYHIPPMKIVFGDPEKALEAAPHHIEGELRSAGQEHFYLETQACCAFPKGEDGEIEVTCSTQDPAEIQGMAATMLGVPRNRVVCRVKRLGGAFGGKETRSVLLAMPVVIAANKFQRPVRAMLDRDEDMVLSGQRHPYLSRYRVGFDAEGRLLAARIEMYSNGGCSLDLSSAVMERALHHCQNSCFLPNAHLVGNICRTNLPSFTAFRGFGAPQAMLIAETIIRQVAAFLGSSALRVTRLNLYKEGDLTAYNNRLPDSNVRRCFEDVLEQADYSRRLQAVREFNRGSRYVKRGLAVLPTTFGAGYSVSFLNQAGALVQVYADGSVLLTHGGTEMGQGLHTKMIQVASRALGIDASLIHISETATDKVPNTIATAASFSSDLNGMAILDACRKILQRLQPYRTANPDCRWEDLVQKAFFDRVSLSATGFYAGEGIDYNIATNSGRPYQYHTYGAACTEVEVDCLTGDHKVLRTDIVMDLGESLNPAIDVGQIEGAFMQGYGLFILEEPVVSPAGALLSRGPGAYKIPGFGDVPAEFNVTLLKGSSNPRAIYSSKAVGEPPLFLACSAFFAIREAVAAARREVGDDGWFRMDAPATAATIRLLCEDSITRKIPEPVQGSFRPWNVRP